MWRGGTHSRCGHVHTNNESPETASSGSGIHEQNRADRDRYVVLEAQRATAADAGDTHTVKVLTDELVAIGTRFVQRNRRLGMKVANQWSPKGNSNVEDYESSALAALWQSFLTWDPDQSTFGTWSRSFISGDVRRQVALLDRKKKYGVFVLVPQIRKATRELTDTLGRAPTHAEIAAVIGSSADMVAAAMVDVSLSLDAPVGGGDDDGKTIADVAGGTVDVDTLADLAPQLATWRTAVADAVADGLTDSSIAEVLGIDVRIVSWLRTDAATEMIDSADNGGLDRLVGTYTTHGDFDEEALWLNTLRVAVSPLTATQLALVVLKDDLHGAGELTFSEIRELTGIGREGARKAYNTSVLALAGPVPVR